MNYARSKNKTGFLPTLIILIIIAIMGQSTTAFVKAFPSSSQTSQPWSFGIIADTQWTVADDGYNPNTSAANIIKQVNQQFINAGVKLVVAVGDTVDVGSATSLGTRALYNQDLYNAGIGFYPLRGNHEAAETPPDLTSGAELQHAFPQINNGMNNTTPADITAALIPPLDLLRNPIAAKIGQAFSVGSNFTYPTAVNSANNSVSYAFQYNNATLMLLDQFDMNGNYLNSTIPQQQQWISDTLAARPANTHAFVFTHKNIVGGNHKDSLFGGNIVPTDPSAGKDPGDGIGLDVTKLTAAELSALNAKQTAENDFLASLQANKVYFLITGHDHHHFVSLVTSPDGASKVHQVIAQSDSSKFYQPVLPVSANDVPFQQDLSRIGYYIVTVDGPRVTMDYYGDTTGGSYYGPNGGVFNFVKISSSSYSLNGKEKVVAQGGSYTSLTDDTTLAANLESGFIGTSMRILSGKNGSYSATNYGKAISNNVTTAWTASRDSLASDILSLRGMTRTMGSGITDDYVLSLAYPASSLIFQNGMSGLLTRTASGQWKYAASQNYGGYSPTFVLGPWKASYTLGTYGIDPATNTAWAVLNYNADFAVGTIFNQFMPVIAR